MDIIVQAVSGIMEVTGFADGPPTRVRHSDRRHAGADVRRPGNPGSLHLPRRAPEKVSIVKVSMLDCLASWVAEEHFDISSQAGYPMRSGNFLDRLAPFGVYHTKDGHVAIAAFSPEWMKGLLEAHGQPHLIDDPRFSSRGPRMQNAGELNAIIEEWTRKLTSEDVVNELLKKRGVPCARVRTPLEVLDDPNLHESGAVMHLEHPQYGRVGAVGMGLPIQFSKSKTQFDQPATQLGAANEQVYGELLKLSKKEIDELRAAGVI